MRTILLLCVGLFVCSIVRAQPYSLSASVDKLFYCTPTSNIRMYGKVTSPTPNMYKGIRYNFYYYNGFSNSYDMIGWYQIIWSGSTPLQTYINVQPAYFDGSQFTNPVNIPQGANTLWMSLLVNYAAFPNNNTGQQLAMDIEAIDQGNNTTTRSSKILFNVPLLYTNPVTLSSAPITASATTICGSDNVQLSGAPNYAPYGFTYDWYKDGSPILLSDNTGTATVNSAGNYYAIVSDACQTATSNTIAITTGAVPAAPTLTSSAGTFLCNGASTTLTAASSGGTVYWNTGATGNSISVSAAGDYYAWEINGCGQSANSSVVHITTGSSPAAASISSSNGTLLCNGFLTTLTASGVDGTVNWNHGQTGTSITVSGANTYYVTQTNACGTSGPSNSIVITTGGNPAPPSVSSSNGTLLCNGASTTLTAGGVDGTVTWNTGQTGSSISVSTSGTYYATNTNACGTSAPSNSVSITAANTPAAPSISSSNGTQLCNGSTTTLIASGVTGTVQWSTGQTGNAIAVGTTGSYYAYQSNSCGTSGNSNTIIIGTGGTPPAPNVTSSNGTFLCNGSSTVLSTSPSAGGTIQWSTGQTGSTITITAPGNYYAWEQNSCGNSGNSNTVTISTGSVPAAPVVSPGYNQLLCNGATATLVSTGSNVSWSTGAVGNNLTVSSAGTYYAVDHNACGNSSPSNQVVITTGSCPLPTPGTVYTICPGTNKTLDAGAGFDSYAWSNGANTRTISVGPGSYSVTVTKDGCTAASGSVSVNYFTVTAPVISPSGNTTFCFGGSVTLSSTPATAYLWNTGATGSAINVNAAGSYNVTATDNNGCQSTSNTITTFVNALPGASISGSTAVCQDGASPSLTFSGSAGTAPYTFSYRVNGGSVQTVTTTSGNSVSVAVPTSPAGSFTYALVSVQESSSTSCSASVSGSATVVVNPLPSATIAGTTTVCQNASAPSVTFTGANGTAPYSFVYRVNGGATQSIATSSGNSVSIAVPTGGAGTFIYSLVSVTDASNTSCSNGAVGSATVVINPLPAASISGTTAVCLNGSQPAIAFTGSNGTAPYTFTYSINGGTAQTVTTSSGNSVSVNVPTNVAGLFTYSLISVRDASSTTCIASASGSAAVTVNELPTATIGGSRSVCQNSASPAITFTATGGSAPYTFIYKVNGGSDQSVTTTTGNSVSVNVATSAPGSFTYTLLSVRDGSSTTCLNTASGTATVVVNQLPTASISGNTAVCQNATAPLITFAGTGGTAPYTFTYRINGGANQTVTTAVGNTVTVAAPTTASGSFTYSLISVQDGSSTGCAATVNGSVTVTIFSLPDAAVISTNDPHLCNGSNGVIKILNYNAGNTYEWVYNGTILRTSTLDTIVNNKPGTFTTRAISAQGCRAASLSNEVKITIGTVPTPVILGFQKVCEGGKTQLLAINKNQPFELWRWTDPPEKKIPRNIYSWDSSFFAAAGQYQILVMAQGCYDSTTITVSASDTEYPAGKLEVSKDTVGYGEGVKLIANVQHASSFHWDFGDGNKAVTSESIVTQHYYKAADSVRVVVDAVSERGCATRFTAWLKVLPQKPLSTPQGFVRGNLKDWNVFPIPFHDHLNVSVILDREQDVSLQLFTADGKMVRRWMKRGSKGENLFSLNNVNDLTTGVMYFITAVYNGIKHFDKLFKY
jgi:hypothetical protein